MLKRVVRFISKVDWVLIPKICTVDVEVMLLYWVVRLTVKKAQTPEEV